MIKVIETIGVMEPASRERLSTIKNIKLYKKKLKKKYVTLQGYTFEERDNGKCITFYPPEGNQGDIRYEFYTEDEWKNRK